MSDEPDPNTPRAEFERDVKLDKPGIVGARWWHKSLMDEEGKVQRRSVLGGFAVAGAGFAMISAVGFGLYKVMAGEPTSLVPKPALDMQRQYGWDFGARGVPLVFNGVAEGPFVRTALDSMAKVMTPAPGPNTKYHVATLVESLLQRPTATLPDPQDGQPAPDSAPFKRVADVLMPVITPEMRKAYAAGETLARLTGWRPGLAVLVDLPGPQAVAFAAGAASSFEPVLLLDNWPHPHGVVPSHMTLAALAYYQPRFESQRERVVSAPLFVLDRARLSPYSEAPNRFDNRYYARMPKLDVLAKDGVRALFYVVETPKALPEPADLHAILSAKPVSEPSVDVRALALSDFDKDPSGASDKVHYGGSATSDAGFWDKYPFGTKSAAAPSAPGTAVAAAKDYQFVPRPGVGPSLATIGTVAVVATASGLILSAALNRQGSMNRFAGGWSG